MSVRRLWALRLAGTLLLLLGLVVPTLLARQRTASFGLGPKKTVGPYRPEIVELPAGKFMMGSPPGELPKDWKFKQNEHQHEVVLTSSFAIARTEVTQDQWTALMGSNPSHFKGADRGDLPVEMVSWFDTLLYLNKLSASEGRQECYDLSDCEGESSVSDGCALDETACSGGFSCKSLSEVANCQGYRLPTEAEWEYAARSGTTDATYGGPLLLSQGTKTARVAVLNGIARYRNNSKLEGSNLDCEDFEIRTDPKRPCGPGRVADKRGSRWGLNDMLGNVYEWTSDEYNQAYFLDETTTSTTNPGRFARNARYAVFRGCGFVSSPAYCRAALRDDGDRALRNDSLGFRPARSGSP